MSAPCTDYASTIAKTGKCPRECPNANPCALEGGVAHAYHICRDATCPCHGAQRYQEELSMALERNQERYPLQHGAFAEVYTRPRKRKVYSCRVTHADGTISEKLDAFATVDEAMAWAEENVR